MQQLSSTVMFCNFKTFSTNNRLTSSYMLILVTSWSESHHPCLFFFQTVRHIQQQIHFKSAQYLKIYFCSKNSISAAPAEKCWSEKCFAVLCCYHQSSELLQRCIRVFCDAGVGKLIFSVRLETIRAKPQGGYKPPVTVSTAAALKFTKLVHFGRTPGAPPFSSWNSQDLVWPEWKTERHGNFSPPFCIRSSRV